MKNERHYYVYIMTNKGDTVFYTGITGDLFTRVFQHKKERSPRVY